MWEVSQMCGNQWHRYDEVWYDTYHSSHSCVLFCQLYTGPDRSPETAAMNEQAYETNNRLEREGLKLETQAEQKASLTAALSEYSYSPTTGSASTKGGSTSSSRSNKAGTAAGNRKNRKE